MFSVKIGERTFKPSINPFNQEHTMMGTTFGRDGNELVLFYEDHDPRHFVLMSVKTGESITIDFKADFNSPTLQEFLSENYERGGYREDIANKVANKDYCPACKEDSYYYMPYKCKCTDFGRNPRELHYAVCTHCNHFELMK